LYTWNMRVSTRENGFFTFFGISQFSHSYKI
jgi:hypothetical protein